MCTPVLAVGAALAVAGAAVKARQQSQANKSARRAADSILTKNLDDQRTREDQRKALLQDSQDQTRPDQQIADTQRDAQVSEALYDRVQDDYGASRDAIPVSEGNGQQTVSSEYKRELAKALSHYKQQGKAQARLNSFGNNNLRLGLDNRDRLSQIASNAQMAISADQIAQEQAQSAYARKIAKGSKFGIGDILAMGGAALSAGAGSFASAAGTAAAAAAPRIINSFGAIPSAPAGTRFSIRAPASSAGGIY